MTKAELQSISDELKRLSLAQAGLLRDLLDVMDRIGNSLKSDPVELSLVPSKDQKNEV